VTYPFFIDVDQKIAVLLADDGPWELRLLAGLSCRAAQARQDADRWPTVGIGQTLDDRCELDDSTPSALRKRYTSSGLFAVSPGTQASTLYCDLMVLQKFETAHH